MARLFTDSCGDHYDWAHASWKWEVLGNGSIQQGRTGKCIALGPAPFSGLDSFNRKNLPGSRGRLICGFRSRFPSLPSVGYEMVAAFWDMGTTQCTLYVDCGGRLSLWLGYSPIAQSQTQVGGFTPACTVRNGTEVYLEMDVTFASDQTGAAAIRANGQELMSVSGVQTAMTAGGANQFSIHSGFGNWGGHFVDDLYVNDAIDDGTGNTGFDGDQDVYCLMPSGPGALTQWTIGGSSPAATNWQSVNESVPDDGATLVAAGEAGQIDLYAVESPVSDGASITAVQMVLATRTDGAGLGAGASIAPALGNGSASPTIGTPVFINTGYSYVLQSFGKNPLTGAAWTASDLAGLQIGAKRTA
jgi:hypothetical protein